jgi:hypothetical protein
MFFQWIHQPVVPALVARALRAGLALDKGAPLPARTLLSCRWVRNPRSGSLEAYWLIDRTVRSGQ